MRETRIRSERAVELSLFLIVAAFAFLLYATPGYKMLVLNLYYLPVVLSAFYLGSQRAGILAVLSVILVSVVAVLDLESFAVTMSPIVIGLSIIAWAASLGLVAIFVGLLSDERMGKIAELHDAYLGIVEVLTHHIKGVDPHLTDRSNRVATLSEAVARQLRLSEKEIDDIRVAALLQDMENIEVTARVIQRAVGGLRGRLLEPRTFQGSDLVQSLTSVLSGALPLILNHTDRVDAPFAEDTPASHRDCPFGAFVIRAVCEYDSLANDPHEPCMPREAINRLRADFDADHHPAVLHALEQTVLKDASDRVSAVESLLRLGRTAAGP